MNLYRSVFVRTMIVCMIEDFDGAQNSIIGKN